MVLLLERFPLVLFPACVMCILNTERGRMRPVSFSLWGLPPAQPALLDGNFVCLVLFLFKEWRS